MDFNEFLNIETGYETRKKFRNTYNGKKYVIIQSILEGDFFNAVIEASSMYRVFRTFSDWIYREISDDFLKIDSEFLKNMHFSEDYIENEPRHGVIRLFFEIYSIFLETRDQIKTKYASIQSSIIGNLIFDNMSLHMNSLKIEDTEDELNSFFNVLMSVLNVCIQNNPGVISSFDDSVSFVLENWFGNKYMIDEEEKEIALSLYDKNSVSLKLRFLLQCSLLNFFHEKKIYRSDILTQHRQDWIRIIRKSQKESTVEAIDIVLQHTKTLLKVYKNGIKHFNSIDICVCIWSIGWYLQKVKDLAVSQSSIIFVIYDLFLKYFETLSIMFMESESLTITFLQKYITNMIISIIDHRVIGAKNLRLDFRNILQSFAKNKNYIDIIGSELDEKELVKLEGVMDRLIIDEIKNKILYYKKLCEKDDENKYIDGITSSFIIEPHILNAGDVKYFVDKHSLQIMCLEIGNNPYTREQLDFDEIFYPSPEIIDEINKFQIEKDDFKNRISNN